MGPRRLTAERRALLAGMAQVPILLPRREQLHRDPQRPRRAHQGRRAGAQLAADPRPSTCRRARPIPMRGRGGISACRRSDLHLRPGPANLVSAPAGTRLPVTPRFKLSAHGALRIPARRRHRPCPDQHHPSELGLVGPAHGDRPAGHRRHRQPGRARPAGSPPTPPPISPSASNGAASPPSCSSKTPSTNAPSSPASRNAANASSGPIS